MRKTGLALTAVLLVMVGLSNPAEATTLSPNADTYVDAWGDGNHGASDSMMVSYSSVPGRIGYLQFDLSGFTLPAGQQVSSVVLHVTPIYIPYGSSDLSVNAVTNDSWSESMLFADRPAYDAVALATETPAGYQTTNFNVTSAFNTSYTPGDMMLSLALTSEGNIIYIASREHASAGIRPTLEITTIPEPATMGLLTIGGVLTLLRRRA